MCGSCSSSPLRAFLRACSVIFANASQAAGFSTRSSGGRDAKEGGNGRGKQDGKGRGFDSPVVSRFFLHPGSHRIKQLSFFFFQLFNDERASRRRCCLSSAAHKSCAKLARRGFAHLPRFIFFPLPLCTTLLATIPGETWKGGPDEFQLYPLYLFPPGQANFTILFRARKRRIERGYDKVEILGLYKLEFFFSWKREFVARRLEKEGKKKGERKREISSGICLGEERFTRE